MLWTWLTHLVTDAITSRLSSKLWFIELWNTASVPSWHMEPITQEGGGWKKWGWVANVDMQKRHWFFVMIGLDQLIHLVTLAITYNVLVRLG